MKNDHNKPTETDPLPSKTERAGDEFNRKPLRNVNPETDKILRLGGATLLNALRPAKPKIKEELIANPDRLAEAKEAEAWTRFGTVSTVAGLSGAVKHRYAPGYGESVPAQSRQEAEFRKGLRDELGRPSELASVVPITINAPVDAGSEVTVHVANYLQEAPNTSEQAS